MNTAKKKDTKSSVGVIVGRFQINELHEGHLKLIQDVQDEHAKVLIFLGVSPLLVTRNNPLDFESRKQMILEKFPQVNVLYAKDNRSDEAWSKVLDAQINDLISPNQTVTLYGGRDSFIARYHGKHKTHELDYEIYTSASEIRKSISEKVESSKDFRAGVIWGAYNQYNKVFTTVDIAILNKRKLLLAKKPESSLYRFVGGFVDVEDESFEDAARREVIEETGLETSEMEYIGSSKIEDWRYRSERDKIKTLFFKTQYTFGTPVASDDISELQWFDIAKIDDETIVPEHRVLFTMLLKNLNLKKDAT